MIVREILSNPELIHGFDLYNDADDTIAWLQRITDHRKELATELAEALKRAWRPHRGQS